MGDFNDDPYASNVTAALVFLSAIAFVWCALSVLAVYLLWDQIAVYFK